MLNRDAVAVDVILEDDIRSRSPMRAAIVGARCVVFEGRLVVVVVVAVVSLVVKVVVVVAAVRGVGQDTVCIFDVRRIASGGLDMMTAAMEVSEDEGITEGLEGTAVVSVVLVD